MNKKIYTVIVIDDNKGVHRDFIALVEENECLRCLKVVRCFTSCRSALRFLQQTGKVDYVFCDIELKNENGLKEAEKFTDLTAFFLFITAYGHYLKKANEIGNDGFLVKPLDPKKIRARIDWLERHRQSGDVIHDAEQKIFVKAVDDPLPKKVLIQDIYALTVDASVANHVCVRMSTGNALVRKSLSAYKAAFLNTRLFVQLSQSLVVALHGVDHLDGNEVYLKDGLMFVASKRYKAGLKLLVEYLQNKKNELNNRQDIAAAAEKV